MTAALGCRSTASSHPGQSGISPPPSLALQQLPPGKIEACSPHNGHHEVVVIATPLTQGQDVAGLYGLAVTEGPLPLRSLDAVESPVSGLPRAAGHPAVARWDRCLRLAGASDGRDDSRGGRGEIRVETGCYGVDHRMTGMAETHEVGQPLSPEADVGAVVKIQISGFVATRLACTPDPYRAGGAVSDPDAAPVRAAQIGAVIRVAEFSQAPVESSARGSSHESLPVCDRVSIEEAPSLPIHWPPSVLRGGGLLHVQFHEDAGPKVAITSHLPCPEGVAE